MRGSNVLSWRCGLGAQEFTLRAIDAPTGKPLPGIPITMRYAGTITGTAAKIKLHGRFMRASLAKDGAAPSPEAGSLEDINDLLSQPIAYGMVLLRCST
jgi:hypothetical protein